MKVFQDLIFDGSIDLGAGSYSPVNIKYYCPESIMQKPYLQKIISLAEEIRGKENPYYDGSVVYVHNRGYKFSFLNATFAPDILIDSARASVLLNLKNETLNYLKRWGLSSIYTFNLYNEFIGAFSTSKEKLSDYYLKEHKFNSKNANKAAEIVLLEILSRAAGSYSRSYGNKDYISPLLASIYDNKDENEIIKLINHETDMDQKLDSLRAAILLNRSNSLVKMLIAEVERLDLNVLQCAVNNYEKTKLLIDLGVDINSENYFGKTALFYAIQAKNKEVVKLLLEKGADINHQYKSTEELGDYIWAISHGERTPLMHAAQHSNVDIIKYLLKKGAKLNRVDENGDNALDYAIRGNKTKNVRFLRSKGLKNKK